jgi:hypothetical protein
MRSTGRERVKIVRVEFAHILDTWIGLHMLLMIIMDLLVRVVVHEPT